MASKSNTNTLSVDHRRKIQERQDNNSSWLRLTWLWVISFICFVFMVCLLICVVYWLYLEPAVAIKVVLELFKYIIGGVIGFLIKSKV